MTAITKVLTCQDCGGSFEHTRSRRGSWPLRCVGCKRKAGNERQYRWREANPEAWKANQDRSNAKRLADPEYRRDKREREISRLYGISVEEFRQMLASQDGCCAICGCEPPEQDDSKPLPRGTASTRLHVDHCHTSGRVRGLLCGNCNTMIGLAGEDSKVLLAAVEYLEKG
jgi:hypothetical protein